MKIRNIISLICFFAAISCSNENEIFAPERENLSLIQAAYEQSKEITLVHNEMLNDFYQYAISNNIKFDKPISNEEIEIFVTQFVNSIDKQPTLTRSKELNGTIDVNAVIKITLMNEAIGVSPPLQHARNKGSIDFAYLDMFCDEFYNIDSDDITLENLDSIIKSILEKIVIEYPYLSKEQIEKLAFVSSITYNSYNYWYNYAMEWIMNLKEGEEPQTRGVWGSLWGAVKSGTQKWAYADTKGAVSAMAGAGLLGNAIAPATALAGAAVGSTIGAIENFF